MLEQTEGDASLWSQLGTAKMLCLEFRVALSHTRMCSRPWPVSPRGKQWYWQAQWELKASA